MSGPAGLRRVVATALIAVLVAAACGSSAADAEVASPEADALPAASTTVVVEREQPDDRADASWDFPYERLEELVIHVDAVGRGQIVDIVGGRTSSVGQNRAFVVRVDHWWRGPGTEQIVVEDGSWWERGLSFGYEGLPWFVDGDEIFFLVHETELVAETGEPIYEATNPVGIRLVDAPVPSRWLPGLGESTTRDEYEVRLDQAVAAIDAGEVDFVTPEERLAIVQTWTGEPALIASAEAVDGSVWELHVVETAVGFCYAVLEAGESMTPGSGCWEWASFEQLSRPLSLPVADGSLFVAAARTGDSEMDSLADRRVDAAVVAFEVPALPVDFFFGPVGE